MYKKVDKNFCGVRYIDAKNYKQIDCTVDPMKDKRFYKGLVEKKLNKVLTDKQLSDKPTRPSTSNTDTTFGDSTFNFSEKL